MTITAFTGQRDHIVTNLIFNKTFHCFNLPHHHFFTKKWKTKITTNVGLDVVERVNLF